MRIPETPEAEVIRIHRHGRLIGEGTYGSVRSGICNGDRIVVKAFKTQREGEGVSHTLLREVRFVPVAVRCVVLKTVHVQVSTLTELRGCPHVCTLLGVFADERIKLVAMEDSGTDLVTLLSHPFDANALRYGGGMFPTFFDYPGIA